MIHAKEYVSSIGDNIHFLSNQKKLNIIWFSCLSLQSKRGKREWKKEGENAQKSTIFFATLFWFGSRDLFIFLIQIISLNVSENYTIPSKTRGCLIKTFDRQYFLLFVYSSDLNIGD